MAEREAKVVFGVPVHNGARHLSEALDSLGSQTLRPAVVAVDDASSDTSPDLLAARPDVLVERSEARLGLVGAWRRAYALALERHPDARYYAWGSDHDIWHPEWTAALAEALDAHPGAVLAYPLATGIDDDGRPTRRRPRRFETRGERDPRRRLRAANAGMRAGDFVYGLYRVDALRRCGSYPATLLPDRLLLARLALEGEFLQVDRPLWFRRYRQGVTHSLERQRRSLFGAHVPLHARLPWWMAHAAWFFASLDASLGQRLSTTLLYLRSATGTVRREHRRAVRRRRARRRAELRRRLAQRLRR